MQRLRGEDRQAGQDTPETGATSEVPTVPPDEGGEAAATAQSATTASSEPAPEVPQEIPGYRTEPVGPDAFRLSQVFRLRNTLLNALSGGASQYSVSTIEASRSGVTSLLIWVAARPGAQVPGVSGEVREILGGPGERSARACGRVLTTYRTAGEALTVLDLGARRVAIALAEGPGVAEDLAAAAARATAADCTEG